MSKGSVKDNKAKIADIKNYIEQIKIRRLDQTNMVDMIHSKIMREMDKQVLHWI